jgi:hypothetical protein
MRRVGSAIRCLHGDRVFQFVDVYAEPLGIVRLEHHRRGARVDQHGQRNAVDLSLGNEVAIRPPADAHRTFTIDLDLCRTKNASGRQQLAHDPVAEAENLLAVAVAGHKKECDQCPGHQVAYGVTCPAAIAARDRRRQKDQEREARHRDGEIGRIEARDGTRIRAQKQRQTGDYEEQQGNPGSHLTSPPVCAS